MEKINPVATPELDSETLEAVRQEWISDLRERGVVVDDNADWLDIIGKKAYQDRVDRARAVGLPEGASLRDIASAEAERSRGKRSFDATTIAVGSLVETLKNRQ